MAEYDLTNFVTIDEVNLGLGYELSYEHTNEASEKRDHEVFRKGLRRLVDAGIIERGPWVSGKFTYRIRPCFLLSPEAWKRKYRETEVAWQRLYLAPPQF